MTTRFAEALADVLFPGDGAIPSATRAGLSWKSIVDRHRPVMEAIAAEAGGEAAFMAADAPARTAVVRAVEAREPQAFQALVLAVSALYHSSAAVLEAYGWPARAPQPEGFDVGTPADAAETDHLLTRVRSRPPLWRAT